MLRGATRLPGTSPIAFAASPGSYGYRVRGCNSGGCGPWSATATVKVATVTDVTGLTATVHYEQTNVTYALAAWI